MRSTIGRDALLRITKSANDEYGWAEMMSATSCSLIPLTSDSGIRIPWLPELVSSTR